MLCNVKSSQGNHVFVLFFHYSIGLYWFLTIKEKMNIDSLKKKK